MKLLLIESAGKLSKLKSILGSGWTVKATMGHIVELANDGEDSLGFTLDLERQRVECNYTPRGARGKRVLAELRAAVKQAETVFLATDPDREGETIAWHLAQQLRLKNPQRVVYSEITEKAVRNAIARPRPIDQNLVAAGRCRDTLDKLVGYKGSPLLWRLNNGAKSMGRVQSATLHILCQREREIKAFIPQDYWSVFVDYAEGFRAYFAGTQINADPTTVESELSDDAADPKDKLTESVKVLSQQQADQLLAMARSHPHQVVRVDSTITTRKPPAPFTTSSLQQAAGSRLKYNAEKTMKIAQSLYEQGFITYLRTDSVALSEDYCRQARQWLQQHDSQNVPERVATQKSKAGAQEAHEAIRPTHVEYTPQSLESQLSAEELRLYELIWNRAIASQCKNASLQKTRIVTQARTAYWQARGQVVTFLGYTRYWNDLSADSQLPVLQQRQTLTLKLAAAEKKQTQPPPRYSEPKLVQNMEKKGIGRPSTYAPTVKVLREREYVGAIKGNLQPTQLGMEVDEFLGKVLPDLIQAEFTAQMEGQLDTIADGLQNWEQYLVDWNQTYFAPALEAAYQALGTSTSSSASSRSSRQPELTEVRCPKCEGMMQKISCRSKKLQADHFLKCSNKDCDTAMFWSNKKQGYELPYSKQLESNQNGERAIASSRTPLLRLPSTYTSAKPTSCETNITQHPCPICSKPLELYEYVKDSEQKKMLRCSDANARRQDNHKKVAFFAAKGGFWSPTYGEIDKQGSSHNPSKTVNTKRVSQQSRSRSNKPSATKATVQIATPKASSSHAREEHPCPVCGEPLELYEYTKDGQSKQMLRCSDATARRQDNHKNAAYFASRGKFWSPMYGEVGSAF